MITEVWMIGIIDRKLKRKKADNKKCYQPFKITGAATKSRTRDLLITSQLLYQLSYCGEVEERII